MRTLSTFVSAALLCAAVPCFGITHSHRTGSAHANIRHSAVKVRRSHASVRHETIAMDSERATQIQTGPDRP